MKNFICTFIFCFPLSFIAFGQGTFRLSSGTRLVVNNGVKIVLNNTSLENNGTAGLGNTSRFIFTGNSPVVTIGGTGNTVLSELELNKPAGIVQLNSPVGILTSVIFTSGNLDLNGNTLFLVADPNGQLIGENNNSRIFGNTGILRKPATLNAPANNNPGNIGVFISSSQNLGATVIDRQHYNINNENVRRVFHITPANNASLNATLQFKYLDAELGALNENVLNGWKSATGTSGSWVNQGGTVDAAQNTVTLNGVNDFSWFTMAQSNAVLPLILTSFTITCNNDNVLLHWQTAQEINTSHFEIQSSADGITWAAIGVVAASGNSGIAVNYQFTNAVTDKKYYRLKMVDKDGQFTFSPVRNVSCAGKNWLITAYPNPATDKIELIINGVKRNSLPVKIVNASGQLVWQQQVTLTNQYSKLTVPLTQLAAGIYFIKIEDAEYKQTITINKQ